MYQHKYSVVSEVRLYSSSMLEQKRSYINSIGWRFGSQLDPEIFPYTLLHELACNIASYCTSGRGIFTSRRRVKMQPTSAILAICMLTSVIKCLLSITNY